MQNPTVPLLCYLIPFQHFCIKCYSRSKVRKKVRNKQIPKVFSFTFGCEKTLHSLQVVNGKILAHTKTEKRKKRRAGPGGGSERPITLKASLQ
jgi:hypothetical protein